MALPDEKGSSVISAVKCVRCSATVGVLINSGLKPFSGNRDFIAIDRVNEGVQRLEIHIEDLKGRPSKVGSIEAIIFTYLLLQDLCEVKASEALERVFGAKIDEVVEWREKASYYSDQSKKLISGKIGVRKGGDDYPYPYIFKPPEPPSGIGVGTNVQLNQPVSEEELEVELFCRYCGSKLGMDESYCSVCGKKA